MVFKNKLFLSFKKSVSCSPASSNSPRSVDSNSPIRSDKNKSNSASNEEPPVPNPSSVTEFSGVGCSQTQIKDDLKKKDSSAKGKQVISEVQAHSIGKSNLSPSSEAKKPPQTDVKEGPAFVSPIMDSSLGLNRIKTNSEPMPQERGFNYMNDPARSNLSKIGVDRDLGFGSAISVSGSGDIKKETRSRKLSLEEIMCRTRPSDNKSDRVSMCSDTGPPNETPVSEEQNDVNDKPPNMVGNRQASDNAAVALLNFPPEKDSQEHSSKIRHNISLGYRAEPPVISEESSIMCRICEEEVPTTRVEDHSRVCMLADKYDQKGLSVDERLMAIAGKLDKIAETFRNKDSVAAADSPDGMKVSNSNLTRFPIPSPRLDPIGQILGGNGTFHDQDDIPQMGELADIAKCAVDAIPGDDQSIPFLLSCLEDLMVVINRRKFDALTIETFGTRIEKLIREKYLHMCELLADENVDLLNNEIDGDAPLEDDVVRSLRISPVHPRDRTCIDDFEIIKPISQGALGRVFLAKKRTTGDLFAIKVLKKADMIRKNAVESILAERDIFINVHNPFVVRFFYSFTCRENLYLVMEYLNGGDLYSLLRNLGRLEEDIVRVYIAEVVLALEYLHSEGVVHGYLKPDNLLIAHDGHIKLTDFGLSKVSLINSMDGLAGPAISGISLLDEVDSRLLEMRKKRSAMGTPDYLAPEIILGTGHGATADWWSIGIILFELIVGTPPFNAEHPQQIFDNILNRKIPWPLVPEEMSAEAHDIIDRFLTEDPHQRLGARGASEVKQHIFFENINWDTLARQKAAFVPASESATDTSYFRNHYSWNTSDEQFFPIQDYSDADSLSNSSGCPTNHLEEGEAEECEGHTEFESGVHVDYSFSNFSFKNLSQLASINYDLLSKGLKDEPQRMPHHN